MVNFSLAYLSNQAFKKYNGMRFRKPYSHLKNKLLTLDIAPSKILENIIKKQHWSERARRLVKFFKNRNKGTKLA